MKEDELLDAIGNVNEKYINKASDSAGRKPGYIRWPVIAAAMILVITIGVLFKTGVIKNPAGLNVKAADLMEGITAKDVIVNKSVKEYSSDISDFSVRLFKKCIENDENGRNTLVSPLSVLLALSLTANGAQGVTLSQMEDVLGMSAPELNEFAYSYLKALPGDTQFSGALELADSIWFRKDPDFTVSRDFLQVNADHYNADIYAAPFDTSTVNDINNWVNQKTKGMIPEVIDGISDNALMYLINALSFDAEWVNAYNSYQVRSDIFTTNDGIKKTVSYLNSSEKLYLEDENAVGFIKYYKGKRYAFVAILPNEGITPQEYLNTVDGEHISDMLDGAKQCEVNASLPKFKTEYSADMTELLKIMGMSLAFDENKADLGKIGSYKNNNLYINGVFHKTFIAVDENGTKAGAVSMITMVPGAMPPDEKPKEVYLTRPFIYMLIDCEANIPFFIGVMNDPEE
ncbi:MAG: serpin family protein [Lachnospiraceae bacterium]|nr:serpin family protein [Lachnospiraceae bacterium]